MKGRYITEMGESDLQMQDNLFDLQWALPIVIISHPFRTYLTSIFIPFNIFNP